MPLARWEHFPHDADVGVRGLGPTIEEAFEMAALALTAVVADPAKVYPESPVHVQCAGSDSELLLVDWLNSVIYEMDTRKMLFSRFTVQINDGRLNAELMGERIDRKRHDPAVDVKGATMTDLKVFRQDTEWIAQCVVDV